MILLAEDEEKIAKLLIHLLKKEGYEVDHAHNGFEALEYVSINTYDLIILDWMMPEMDGIEACKAMRLNGYEGGILMLTAKDTLDNKIKGLESGADDYLVKPFEFRELKARLRALERRSSKSIRSDQVAKGDFKIDRTQQKAYYKDDAFDFSKKEYLLFELLFENAGNTITRATLIDRVWGIDGEITENNLEAYIRLLRKKIKVKSKDKIIVTVRGIGYKMEV